MLLAVIAFLSSACGTSATDPPSSLDESTLMTATPVELPASGREAPAGFTPFLRLALEDTTYGVSDGMMAFYYQMSEEWICVDLQSGTSLSTMTAIIESVEVIHEPRSDVPVFAAAIVEAAATFVCPIGGGGDELHVEAAELGADIEMIRSLFRNWSDSWSVSVDVGHEVTAESNYPPLGCSADDYARQYPWPEGFRFDAIVDVSTIERDDDWVSPALGIVPDGRLYILQVTFTYNLVDGPDGVQEVHATILDDAAYFFVDCR